MMKEFKNMQKGNSQTKENKLWCTECKTEGHTKGSCPKNQFCDICQIMGHSTKECPFNMKTRGHQQVLLRQEGADTLAMMVPLRMGTEIIEEGKTTIPTIIMGAAAEFSMMQTAA